MISGGRISGAITAGWDHRFDSSFFDKFIHDFFYNDSDQLTAADNLPQNDQARSLEFNGMLAGRSLIFFDSPSAETDDDWVEILIKKPIPATDVYRLDTFEQSYEDDYVKVTSHYHNGLDGKVSYLRTYMTN
ncbi:hypothetical protein [Mucilaginibacter aquaedulcis]|uniref:hypothetical protein n=1 Tax=Mucilaginibacter aquaedulcis TaxID=1187081 RepID=UPI0025B3B36A|nr:hypothetical protein [Mucilaginibacter aquaedulcis]MDN3548790.1 hypothetical protein [Mucilaginibacter aquaedulcis]